MSIKPATLVGALTILGIVILAWKFKNQGLALIGSVPVVGPIVAGIAA